MVFRATESLHALAGLRAVLVDVARDRRRAHKGDRLDVGVLEDGVDGDLVALDHVEHAVGQARLLEQFGQVEGGRWILLGWLQDEAITAGDRVGEHPHGHHHGEVERRDARDDAERLADRIDVDAGRGLLRVATLEELRDATCELEVFEASSDFTEGVCGDLAVLGRQDRGDFGPVLVDEIADLEQDLGAARERGRSPGREGGLGGRDGFANLFGRGELHFPREPAPGGVVHRAGSTGRARHALAADPVADSFGARRRGLASRLSLCDLRHG